MATEQRKATVIIAGSGLTGLTLALMLQDLGVDYLLLEAYDSCTPNVGASIAIQPQGMRVLHQLGVHEDIEALFQPVWRAYAVDADTGKGAINETNEILRKRHGYDTGYFNRYDLLCVLYKHVREKHRLLNNQKIVHIDNLEDRAVVQTKAGDVFEAQVVIGADGVRSTVRKEMWRNAAVAGPSAVPEADKKEIICDWATCFGVSDYGSHLPRGLIGSVTGDHYNAGWMTGKDGRTFTFWTFKLPEESRYVSYDNIPRFTEADHERAIARGKEILRTVPRNFGLDLDFDKLYDQRDKRHSGITALPHFVLKKWHFGRLVVIGDASHKFNPLPGHGGMNCIVSAATLINCLQDTLGLDTLKTSTTWAMEPLDAAFTTLASTRVADVENAVAASEDAMNLYGWSTPTKRILFKILTPLTPDFMAANGASAVIEKGTSLKGWGVPDREHSVPYADEKQALRSKKSAVKLSPGAVLGTATAAAVGGIVAIRAFRENPGLLAEGWKALQAVAVAK